ncbi:MAG: hypothetical protein JEZ12_19545 [Desulfobacterium sp.]|nr:hypothetical protein [Desulfobacterium sp.]
MNTFSGVNQQQDSAITNQVLIGFVRINPSIDLNSESLVNPIKRTAPHHPPPA